MRFLGCRLSSHFFLLIGDALLDVILQFVNVSLVLGDNFLRLVSLDNLDFRSFDLLLEVLQLQLEGLLLHAEERFPEVFLRHSLFVGETSSLGSASG